MAGASRGRVIRLNACHERGAVDAGGVVELLGDPAERGTEEQHREADPLPGVDQDDDRQRGVGLPQPRLRQGLQTDGVEEGVQRAELRPQHQHPQVADDQRADQVGQRVERLEQALGDPPSVEKYGEGQPQRVLDQHRAEEEHHVVPERAHQLLVERERREQVHEVLGPDEGAASRALPVEQAVLQRREQRVDDEDRVQEQGRREERREDVYRRGRAPSCPAPPISGAWGHASGLNHCETPFCRSADTAAGSESPSSIDCSPAAIRSLPVGSP